jgi:hypothetical protein
VGHGVCLLGGGAGASRCRFELSSSFSPLVSLLVSYNKVYELN